MGKERRRHKRYSIKGLRSRLRKSRLLGFSSEPTSEEYPCLDISQGGLQFITKKALQLKSHLLLDITTPFLRSDPIRTKARVAWSKSLGGLSFYVAGVRFVSVGKSERARLKVLIERAGQDKDKIPQRIRVKMIKEASSQL